MKKSTFHKTEIEFKSIYHILNVTSGSLSSLELRLRFFLLPFNFFDETDCPALLSADLDVDATPFPFLDTALTLQLVSEPEATALTRAQACWLYCCPHNTSRKLRDDPIDMNNTTFDNQQ